MKRRIINGGRLRALLRAVQQTGLAMLAWSAAVDLNLLNTRKADGQFYYARGRYKYLGLGALVIFFAGFAGYGMAHMLASMAQFSTTAAMIGGLVWGGFQWCLERQMMMAIRSDANRLVKFLGLSWRAGLALLSALTMVYPFFVDTNRSEINLRSSQLERQRLQENLSSAGLASGLNLRQHESDMLIQTKQTAEQALASEAPQLAGLRQQAQGLRAQIRRDELKQQQAIQAWQNQLSMAEPSEHAGLKQKIQQAQLSLQRLRLPLQRLEQEIQSQAQSWRQQKQAEYAEVTAQLQQAQQRTALAQHQAQQLQQQQAAQIQAATQAGFAADFAASWDMLQHDQHRRWQFIWWLAWFYLIELIAIVVKLTQHTELDARICADERLALLEIASQLRLQSAQLELSEQQAMLKIKAEQLAMQADAGVSQAALSLLQSLQPLQQASSSASSAQPMLQQLLHDSLSVVQAQFLRQLNKA